MNRKVLLAGIGAAIGFAALWFLLMYRPAGNDLTDARDEREQVRDELSALQAQLGRLRSVEADLPRLQSGIESLRSAVPDDPALADFILAANEAAEASGLELDSISAGQPGLDPRTGLYSMTISLAFDSGYYQMLDFLNRLQSMHRVISVGSLRVAASENDESPTAPPDLSVTLTAEIYSTSGVAVALPAPVQDAADQEITESETAEEATS